MRFTRILFLILLVLAAISVSAQDGDFDGDGVPDSLDYCFEQPGTADLNGCTPATFPDYDLDTVADPVDSCPNDPGLPDNSGCAEGVIPDFDSDGLPDPADRCPRDYGDSADGCPPDADADAIPDFSDACPTQAGVSLNLGCPEGVTPPDNDGDTVPDLYDACWNEAGSMELGGCADSDGDGTVNRFDVCPAQAGDLALSGCLITTTTTLPANLSVIHAGNAQVTRLVGQLIVGAARFAVSGGNALAVRGDDQVYVYDLNSAALTPRTLTGSGTAAYPVALSAAGDYLALLDFPADFSTPPFVGVYAATGDGALGDPLAQLVPPPDDNGDAVGISAFAFSPTDPTRLAVAPLTGSAETVGVTVPVYDVAANAVTAQFALPGGAVNLAFSPDGTRFALDTSETETMAIYVFDAAAGTQIARIATTSELHFAGTPLAFNADGTRLAAGYPDGSVHVFNVSGEPAERFAVDVFGQDEIVSAVAVYGSVIAVAGGVPFSGGLTGDEAFTLVLLNADTGAELARWNAHESLIRDLAFNATGTLLISAADSTVKFWGIGG